MNRFCMCVVLMLMNILINFDLFMLKNGMVVLLVIVLVSSVLFVFGVFMSNIFLGILLFRS